MKFSSTARHWQIRCAFPPKSFLHWRENKPCGKPLALETEIFQQLREEAVALADEIEACAKALAALDVTTALASLAVARDWVQPEMRDDLVFDICGGRHPVVEAALLADGGGPFIPNDCALDGAANAHARLTC